MFSPTQWTAVFDSDSNLRPLRDSIKLTHISTQSYCTQGFTVKENLSSRLRVDLRDILLYNRCVVTLPHDPREIREYTWSDDILQLAAGGPASLISRFCVRARAHQGPRSIDRDYMRYCPHIERFGGSDTTVRTIAVTTFDKTTWPWGYSCCRSSSWDRCTPFLTDSMVCGLVFLDWRSVLLRLHWVEDGVVCGGYDVV